MLKFKCPKCGKKELEEILVDCVQTTVINAITEDGIVDYDQDRKSTEGGTVENYQCVSCGYILINDEFSCTVSTDEDLAIWLKENCEQEDNPDK